jgi:hypothetical protein
MPSWTCPACGKEHPDGTPQPCPCVAAGTGTGNKPAEGEKPAVAEATDPYKIIPTGAPEKNHGKKLTVCENCYHKHHDGVNCHVFIESAISADGVGADDDDDFDDGFIEQAPAPGAGGKEERRPLGTPNYIKRIRYVRCNCTVGVPSGNAKFKPLPLELVCPGSDIRILTYDMVLAGLGNKDRTAKMIAEERIELLNKIGDNIPYIGQFVMLGHVGWLAKTCKRWAAGANNFPEYVDVRNFVPWQIIHAHNSQVDSLIRIGNQVYSGGDKRIMVSDVNSGQVLHQVTRDTGSIPLLDKFEQSLICCSASGAMRFFGLSFNVKRIKLELTMWEHSRRITQILMEFPASGLCEMHGIDEHICLMYTASEDRTIRVWDMKTMEAVKCVTNNTLRNASITSMTQSLRHVMVGTTDSQVLVFSKTNSCDRQDFHVCGAGGGHTYGLDFEDKTFCLQVTLKLPYFLTESGNSPSVTVVKCTGWNFGLEYLWATDSIGRITVWRVPDEGFEYEPVRSWRAHSASITSLVTSWTHAFTGGDDGLILLHDLASLAKVRVLDVTQLGVDMHLTKDAVVTRRIKSMSIEQCTEEQPGSVICGCCTGEIFVMCNGYCA